MPQTLRSRTSVPSHVLLSGSSGWLARFLVPQLHAAGYRVTGLDPVAGSYTDIVASVTDRPIIDEAFKRLHFDVVIHAGALHKPDMARFPAQAFIDVNVGGTLNLLRAAQRAGHERFIFTSTTSLMISNEVRAEAQPRAAWIDETRTPLEPRNIYGVTKLAAEDLCRGFARDYGLRCVALRTARFFPEEDDSDRSVSGENLKANEFLHRRLTAADAARAHLAALGWPQIPPFAALIVSALSPFLPTDVEALMQEAPRVIAGYFPDAAELYARRGWRLPEKIGRVYDARSAAARMGFRCETGFAQILAALREDARLPFAHDPGYLSPSMQSTPK